MRKPSITVTRALAIVATAIAVAVTANLPSDAGPLDEPPHGDVALRPTAIEDGLIAAELSATPPAPRLRRTDNEQAGSEMAA
jgi:hypothetical protein